MKLNDLEKRHSQIKELMVDGQDSVAQATEFSDQSSTMEEILKEGQDIKTIDPQTIYNSGGAAGMETIILVQKSAASTEDQKDPKLMPAQLKSILGRHQSADVRNIANQI